MREPSPIVQEEIDRLKNLGKALREAGPVNKSNPLGQEGASKAHRTAAIQFASEKGREAMKKQYDSMGLDY